MLNNGILLRICFLLSLASTLVACIDDGGTLLFAFSTDTPSNLSTEVDDRNITVSWNAVDNADSYTLFRYTNSDCATLPDNYSACDSSYRWHKVTGTEASDPNLLNDTLYYYRVMAHSRDGDSELSAQTSGRTAAAVAPDSPQNLQWQLIGADAIQLTWDASSDVNYYVVYRVTDIDAQGCSIPNAVSNCGDSAEMRQSADIVDESSWLDDELNLGLSYYYVLVAYNIYASSSTSSSLIQTKPAAPAITSASLGNSGLSLEWTSELGASSYELFRYSELGCLDNDNIDSFSINCLDSLHVVELDNRSYLDVLTDVDALNAYYRLRSVNSSGYSLLSSELGLNLPLAAPEEFNLSYLDNGSTNYLQWSPVLLAGSYTLYRYQEAGCALAPDQCSDSTAFVLDGAAQSYTDSQLDPGAQHYYSIRATNSWYQGAFSQAVDAIAAPEAATNVAAVAGDGTIELTWDEHANSATTVYTIYRDTCAPSSNSCNYLPSIVGQFQVGSRTDGANSFSDTDLSNAESYYYIVSVSAGEWDINSSAVSATTHPQAFTNLTASATSSQSIALIWSNPNGNSDDANNRMYVYPCDPDTNGCTPEIHELGAGTIYAYEAENLMAGTRYYFKVAAYTDAVEVNSSIADTYTAVSAPTNITHVSDDGGSVVVSWDTDNSAETLYSLEVVICQNDNFNCNWDSSFAESTSANNVTLAGLFAGSAYEVRVIASVADYSATSATAIIYTYPVAPSIDDGQFTIAEISESSVSLNWSTSINGSNSQYIPTRYACDLAAGDSCSGLPLTTLTSTTTAYTDNELNAASEYSYAIRVLNDSLDVYSESLSIITAPAAITSISTTSGDRNISLSWVHGNTSEQNYTVYQSELDCSVEELLAANTVACGSITEVESQIENATFTSLVPATRYYYRLVTQNTANGLSSVSDAVSEITWPEAPTDLDWTSTSDDITVTWDIGANGNVATWKVYRYPCDPEGNTCLDDPHTVELDYVNSSHTDSHDLIRAQEYYYLVSVIAGSKEIISTSTIAIIAPNSADDLDLTAGAVNTYSAADTAAASEPYVELDWGLNGNILDTNHTIYRQQCAITQNCASYQFGSYSGAETYSTINAYNAKDVDGFTRYLDPATTYYYIISATNTTSTGRVVETLTSASVVTHPVVAQDISADAISSSSADINWSAGENGSAALYSVRSYYCLDASSASCSDLGVANDLEPPGANITGLAPGSYYAFAVSTYAGSNSITSDWLTGVATQPVAITNVAASTFEQDGSATLEINWHSVNGSAAIYSRYLYKCISTSTCNDTLLDPAGELGTNYTVADSTYTWIDTGLDLGTLYKVVMSVTSDGVELSSDILELTTLPDLPSNLMATTLDNKSIELQWSDANNNSLTVDTDYQIYAFRNDCTAEQLEADINDVDNNDCAIAEAGSITKAGTNSTESHTFTSLSSGTTYYLAVRASNIGGTSWVADTGQTQATTETSGISSIDIDNITSTGFDVSLQAVADEPDAVFRFYLAECNQALTCGDYEATVLASGDFDHSYASLIPGQHYSLIASASAAGAEANSSAESIITLPTAVTDLSTQGQALGSIDINFTTSNGSATSYKAYRYNCGYDLSNCVGAEVEVAIDISDSNYSDPDLDSATYYFYTVGASAAGQELNATATPALTAPAILDISNSISAGENDISIDYAAPIGVLDSYYLVLSESNCTSDEISTSADNCGTIATSAVNTTSVRFGSLTANTTYYLRSVVSNATATTYSSVIATLTRPVTPTDLAAVTKDSSSIELTWLDAADEFTSGVSYQAYAFTNACTAEQLAADSADDSIDDCAIAETDYVDTRAHTFEALSSGTTYYLAVRASNSSGSSWVADAKQIQATTATSGARVGISNVTSTSFDVSLNPTTSEPSTTYGIYFAECSGINTATCAAYDFTELPQGVFNYSYTNLIPGQHYMVIGSASAAGFEVNSTLNTVTSPVAVSDLTAQARTSGSLIDINFTTSNGSAASYTAYRYNCGYDPTSCATVGVEDISTIDGNYTDDDASLSPATYYSYTIGVSADDQEVNASNASPVLTAPQELDISSATLTIGVSNISVDSLAAIPSGALDSYHLVLSELDCSDADITNNDTINCGTIRFSDANASVPVVFDSLNANSKYYLRSLVSNATADIYSSSTIDLLTLPLTPIDLEATTQGTNAIELQWGVADDSLVTDITYQAYAFANPCTAEDLTNDIASGEDGDPCGIKQEVSTSANSYIFSSLSSGTSYYFVVRALNSSGISWSADTGQAQAMTDSKGIDSIATANISSDSFDIDISVDSVAREPDTIYRVYLAECDAPSTCGDYAATELAPNILSHSYTNLIAGQHYSVLASASANSTELNSSAESLITLPAAVSNFTAQGQASGNIDISFTSSNGSAATYTAYRYNCAYDQSCTSASLETSITITGSNYSDDAASLAPATYYSYIVGVTAAGEEANATTTTPALTAPQTLDISAASVTEDQNSIAVVFDASTVSGVIDSYYLVLSESDCDDESNTNCGAIYLSTSNATSVSFDSLSTNTTYYLRSAVKNATATTYSTATAHATLPATPTLTLVGAYQSLEASFTSSSTNTSSFTLHLSDVSCADFSVAGNCSIDHSLANLTPGVTFTLSNGSDGIASDYFKDGATYYAAIEASNSSGSSYSAVAEATTNLGTVANIVATGGDQSITLDWDFSTGATAYHARVYGESCDESYMSSSQDGSLSIAACNNTELHAVNLASIENTTTVSGLNEGERYYYRIGNSSSDGSAFWSAEAAMDTLPAAVSSASLSETATASVQVDWTDSVSSAITRYDIYSFTGSNCSDSSLLALATSLGWQSGSSNADANCPDFKYASDATSGFTVSGLATSTTYYFRIAAVNLAGSVFYSPELSLTTSSALEDPLAYEQWHLENTGSNTAFASDVGVASMDINYTGVLATGLTGNGVRVNVIDSGLEMQHPDLFANILADGSYDFVEDDNDPTSSDTGGDHGTSVAGIIAAAANGVGGVGVAPRANLQGFNFLESASNSTFVASVGGDDKLADTAIFNQSFGTTAQYDHRYGSDRIDALSCFTSGGAFDLASGSSCTSALRSGLGALYVKSAGNSFTDADDDDWCRIDDINLTCFNANMDNSRTYPYQIVVGALNAYGLRSSYSTAGSSIWLTAPGGEFGMSYEHVYAEISKQVANLTEYKDLFPASYWQPAMITTDQVGCERGYSTRKITFVSGTEPVTINPLQDDRDLDPNCEYTATFNGTSSAAPVVSGVIALMLEANPDLTWRDVKHILASTARQVDSSIAAHSVPLMLCASDCSDDQYTPSTSTTFLARAAWATNAAGYNYHNWYGFGLVNAGAAVAMAQSYSSTLGAWNMASVDLTSIDADIPDADGSAASIAFTIADDLVVEAAQLDLQITHHYLGALAVVLTSPSGTRSVLLTPYNQYEDNANFDSTLLSNAFYGESAAGDWTLEVYDLIQDQSSVSLGTLDSGILKIYGHLEN